MNLRFHQILTDRRHLGNPSRPRGARGSRGHSTGEEACRVASSESSCSQRWSQERWPRESPVAGKGNGNNKTFEYAIGLWGDMPYSDVQAQTGVPNVIADMNGSDISFSVHDGDLKAGQRDGWAR
jgi:hypothetical protein